MPDDSTNARWIRLAANYLDDPRIVEAGPMAELIYVRGLAVARNIGTDGALRQHNASTVTRDLRHKEKLIHRLLEVGLWEPTDDGWTVPFERWARWQTTQEQYEHQRKLARERQARRRGQTNSW
jgi:hypothetical protein